MGNAMPSIRAGCGVPCPYKIISDLHRYGWATRCLASAPGTACRVTTKPRGNHIAANGGKLPRMFAGHGIPCPYKTDPELNRGERRDQALRIGFVIRST
jgi:hypothetical protein